MGGEENLARVAGLIEGGGTFFSPNNNLLVAHGLFVQHSGDLIVGRTTQTLGELEVSQELLGVIMLLTLSV